MSEDQLILVTGALMAAALVAALVAGRMRVPGLVLFLGLGMAIGSDGTGWIRFDDYELARRIGIVALALILFEGGLTSGFGEIRPVLAPTLSLATLGTLITAAIAGLAAAWLFGFSTLEGLLLGSVVAATDSAAIFAVLRQSTLRRKLARTLEGEAGLNDPVAVLLVLGFIDWILKPDYGVGDMAALFVRQMGIGLAVGVAMGWLGVQAFRRLRLATPGLYPVASIAIGALAYGGAATLRGSGFIAVYLAGLALGSAPLPAKQTVTAFHQGLAWVAQISLFVTLGLLVFPSQLGSVAVEGTALALVLGLVARPVATLLAPGPAPFSLAERAVLGWAGLRGAVPVVLATFAVTAHVPHSLEFFNIVFFAVLVSTLVQGATFEPVARRLGATSSQPALPRPLTETGTIRRLGAEVVEYPVGPEDAIVGVRIRDLGLPRDALVNVIVREHQALPPRGSTRVEGGDRLHVLVRQENARDLEALLERWRDGPVGRPPRPRATLKGRAPIFHHRPWSELAGDPTHPRTVLGHRVVDQLRTRRDMPGALVLLEDGRYAITGPTVAVGGRELLTQHARRQLRKATSDAERAWWEEAVGALAL
ncbi:MAG: potassium/proton antiporter [Actinomycetota bacterium]|nr:potassium/proton antiporter [Actinomycetota bacterium]